MSQSAVETTVVERGLFTKEVKFSVTGGPETQYARSKISSHLGEHTAIGIGFLEWGKDEYRRDMFRGK